MSEKHDFHLRESIADKVEGYAEIMGFDRNFSAELLVTIGTYVVSNLAAGKEFILKSGDELNHVEWRVPQSTVDDEPPRPPTLRIIK